MSQAKGKPTAPVTEKGYAYIKVNFNNTLVTMTNSMGQPIAWSSAGKVGFKGSKKNTPYAGIKAAQDAASKALKLGLKEVVVRVKGISMVQEAAIRAVDSGGLKIRAIEDWTPIRHNGCRPPRARKS